MSNKQPEPSKTIDGDTTRRPFLSRRMRVIVHVVLSLIFATVVSWQVARFLE